MKPWNRRLARASPERLSSVEPRMAKSDKEIDPLAAPTPTAWIDDRQLSLFVLMSLTAGTVYLTYIIFRPFLTALFVALIMAVAFSPLHKSVARRIHSNDVAALITTVLSMLLVLVPFILVSVRLGIEVTNFVKGVLQQLGNPNTWPDQLNSLIQQAAEETGMPAAQLKADISVRGREVGVWVLGFATSLAQRFFRQMMTVLLGSVFLFSLLRHSDELRQGALSLLPLSPHRARELAVAVNQGIIANIYGMFTVGIFEGILIAIGFWMAGLRSPLLWGTLATVLSCLPVVGVSLVWMPACIILALRGNWTSAVLLCIWGVVVVSAADGIVRSRVVSGRVKVNPLLITLSLMGGLSVFGAIGFFVGPVVVVVLASLVRILREEHASVQEARERAA